MLTATALLAGLLLSGCGKTVRSDATEQLILSDAVDRSIRNIDFSPLNGRDCYLDTTYIKTTKSPTFVNAEYLTSSLRNQALAAGCRLVEKETDAEVIIEPRVGVLGADQHEVTYGFPSNNVVTQAASVAAATTTAAPVAAPIASLPEISLARRAEQTAAAKVAVFAFDAKTKSPIWQSGMSVANSRSRDWWLFGIGPFQSGTIYDKTRFAGTRFRLPLAGSPTADEPRQAISLDQQYVFTPRASTVPAPDIKLTSGETAAAAESDADGKASSTEPQPAPPAEELPAKPAPGSSDSAKPANAEQK
ncbi:hypothetical protein GC176_09295 [bacterium]|nr:hypothetical protein [bacterium]